MCFGVSGWSSILPRSQARWVSTVRGVITLFRGGSEALRALRPTLHAHRALSSSPHPRPAGIERRAVLAGSRAHLADEFDLET